MNRAIRPQESIGSPSRSELAIRNMPDLRNEFRSLKATSRQGEIHFSLQRVAGGLYVEREDIPRRGLRTMQSVQFSDAVGFNRWCDADPIRFDHPLLHIALKRDGGDLWRSAAYPVDG